MGTTDSKQLTSIAKEAWPDLRSRVTGYRTPQRKRIWQRFFGIQLMPWHNERFPYSVLVQHSWDSTLSGCQGSVFTPSEQKNYIDSNVHFWWFLLPKLSRQGRMWSLLWGSSPVKCLDIYFSLDKLPDVWSREERPSINNFSPVFAVALVPLEVYNEPFSNLKML